MSVIEILAVIAIVGYVIFRQLRGEHLRGKRLIALPVVLAVAGAIELFGQGRHPGVTDIAVITTGAVVAAGIGAYQGSMMHLEAREGTLWGQMPRRSLWLWLALVLSRVVLVVVATALGAHMAASTAAILFTLGINRLTQAAVIAPRAMASGIPFTPEKDGATFLGDVFGPGAGDRTRDISPAARSFNGVDNPDHPTPGNELGHELGNEWKAGVKLIADRLAARSHQR